MAAPRTTWAVVVAVGVVAAALTGWFLWSLSRPADGRGYRAPCRETLSILGKAIYAYSLENAGCAPFDERGPLHSLGLLYPRYLDQARAFVSPTASETAPFARFPENCELAGAPCSFGYTWRVPQNPPNDFAIVADMPANHADAKYGAGFHVLYADGYNKWQTTPFCSHSPADNIFAPEPGWSPDTDSYIRQD